DITGGGNSPLFFVYALTTVFFALSYPPAGQVGLLAFTYASYLAVVAASGWDVSASVLFLRFALLACVTFLGAFMARQSIEQLRALGAARRESDHRAGLLAAVAAAAQAITTLHG